MEELKKELMAMCEVGIDEMLADCKREMDFAEIEKKVEKLSKKILPDVLAASSDRLAIFPPEMS